MKPQSAPADSPHVLWLTPWYPDENHPYRAAYIRAQFEAVRLHLNAQLIFVDVEWGSRWWDARWERMGPEVFRLRIRSRLWKTVRFTPRILADWAARSAFRSIPELRKPDLIHGNIGFPGAPFAQQFARHIGVPYVVTEHWSKAVRGLNHWGYGSSMRRAYRGAACIFPVSEHLKSAMQGARIRTPMEVIPNVLDFKPYAHRSRFAWDRNPSQNVWHWVSVASLIPANAHIKRVEWIIDALAWYKKNKPDRTVYWTHVGAGDRLAELQAYARERGVFECIEWAGARSPEEIGQLLRGADLFLHPTTQETFGLVVREALATGLPAVTTRIPAHESFWSDSFGLLTELNSDSFLKGIQGFENERPTVPEDDFRREIYSSDAVGRRLADAYSRVMNAPVEGSARG